MTNDRFAGVAEYLSGLNLLLRPSDAFYWLKQMSNIVHNPFESADERITALAFIAKLEDVRRCVGFGKEPEALSNRFSNDPDEPHHFPGSHTF
ncbi:MAG TPA: hypothetical protein VN685_02215 [Rhizomicrobium sp.]|nr:hypothetical protein [Rhizomicrobium sp.]